MDDTTTPASHDVSRPVATANDTDYTLSLDEVSLIQAHRRAEQREIADRHRRGLHFIGDWHTYPEAEPVPSGADSASMREMVSRSQHNLNCFVLVIAGCSEPPQGLYVALYDGVHELGLKVSAS